jgi:hypothetical protein
MNVLVLNAGSASLKFEVITALTNDDTVFHRIPDQASTYLLILQTESFHPHGLTPEAFADLITSCRGMNKN